MSTYKLKKKSIRTNLCGALCGEAGGDDAGESAGVAGAEAARRREYSEPPTAMAEPPPTASLTRVTLRPEVDLVGLDVAVVTKMRCTISNIKKFKSPVRVVAKQIQKSTLPAKTVRRTCNSRYRCLW